MNDDKVHLSVPRWSLAEHKKLTELVHNVQTFLPPTNMTIKMNIHKEVATYVILGSLALSVL